MPPSARLSFAGWLSEQEDERKSFREQEDESKKIFLSVTVSSSSRRSEEINDAMCELARV